MRDDGSRMEGQIKMVPSFPLSSPSHHRQFKRQDKEARDHIPSSPI